jgi:hypothetical protein
MAARKSVAAIPIFHANALNRPLFQQRHHQRFEVEIMFMRFQ